MNIKRVALLCAVLAATWVAGPPVGGWMSAASTSAPAAVAAAPVQTVALASGCAGGDGGVGYGSAPGLVSAGGVQGTTSADLASFAARYNAIRVSACLAPIPPANFRFDACLQQRLFWVAEDPSTNRASAWGHRPQRSDGAPVVGCDGNLAGGNNFTGSTVADRWWASPSHQASLYRPGSTANPASICIGFAMTHGGVPNEPASFVRASAVRYAC